MDITEEIRQTAALMNICVSEDEVLQLKESFTQLLAYFEIMQEVSSRINSDTSVQAKKDTNAPEMGHILHTGVLRDDSVDAFENTSDLIERSAVHEDNFVLIPNVL